MRFLQSQNQLSITNRCICRSVLGVEGRLKWHLRLLALSALWFVQLSRIIWSKSRNVVTLARYDSGSTVHSLWINALCDRALVKGSMCTAEVTSPVRMENHLGNLQSLVERNRSNMICDK